MSQKTPVNYALLLLKIRDRSTEEIRAKMRRKGFLESEITKTVDFLNDRKFLDDRKFAANYLKSQINNYPQGKRRLYAKLRQVYLPDDIITETLANIDSDGERQMAADAAERWLNKHQNVPAEEIKIKLSRYLAERGFNWEIAEEVIKILEYRL